MIKILKITFSLTLLIILSFFTSSYTKAQEKGGITVIPSIIHLDLEQDPAEYQITYANTTKTEINLLLNVQDFSELEDAYRINFLDRKDAQNYKYSLSSWISFENKNVQLAPGEKKSVKIFIDKDRITKGGHYASILAEIIQPEREKQVNVKAVLSSLLFVRASTGLEIEDGKISSLLPVRDNLEYPDFFMVRFENAGNVHVIPYGLLEVSDPLGNLVSTGILNEGSLDALPESIRRYDISVENNKKVLLPGFYTAKISIHFGKSDKKLSSSVRFFSQGSFDFIKIGLGALILIILILYLRRRIKNKH
jgi:hypothetical protein